MQINSHQISTAHPTYIVAEMSANHHHSFDRARRIIEAAREAGADAIKLQTYTADTLTIDCDAPAFRLGADTAWAGRTLYELYEQAHTPWDWQPRLQEFAHDLGLDFFSTPFDDRAVAFLEEMDVPAHKVASFELIHTPLLKTIGATKKPVIMSTGMATLAEIDRAVRTLRDAGTDELCLLKCTSAYPAPPAEANLRTIPHLSDAFDVPAGLSDHTMTTAVPVAAVTLGACLIEKHLTLSRDDDGPDSAFSLDPLEFKQMVQAVRTTEEALGSVHYELTEKQRTSQQYRRSLFAVEPITEGQPFTPQNVRIIRPALGLSPDHYESILGRQTTRSIEPGTPLDWDLIQ